jgi:2,3-bisphosphoglycerate-dependent phosphoglycerate mutase
VELLFVRHGEPAWSRDGLAVDDPPLTERGQQQAKLLARVLGTTRIDRLLVSPLQRAQQTAEPIAEATGSEPTTLPWLAEIWPGAWEGTPQDVVEQTFRENRNRPLDDQWEGIPGGESFREFHERVTTGLQQLLDASGVIRTSQHPPLWQLAEPDQRIVVVAHGGTNAVSLGYVLGIEPVPWEWERFVAFHASVSTVRPLEISRGHSFSLFRMSDTAHLPDDLVTR